MATIGKDVDISRSYTTVVELLHGVMLRDRDTLCADYRQPFTNEIWKRIHENVIHRFFPATLRVYLEYFGFLLIARMGDIGTWADEERERVRRLLYVDLKPLFDSHEKMINDEPMQDALLPQVMSYQGGRFYYRARHGKATASEIAPPPTSARSALEGVKDRFDGS